MPKRTTPDDVEERGHARYIMSKHPTLMHTKAYGWLAYNGRHWERDGKVEAEVFNLVSNTLEERRKAIRSNYASEARELEGECEPSVRRIHAVTEHLRALCAEDAETLDVGHDYLNVANGLVDLRNGEVTKHHPNQRFTYSLEVPYFTEADPSVWEAFLTQVVGGGKEVVEFLQRCVGYSITGRTEEEKMFYVYGPTRSGKGAFTETLLSLLGIPLATEVDFTTFTRERQQDANNFDLAPLKPARFLAASESSRYERLNEAKVKQMTGGNYIRCAFKYSNHFSYRPQYKIWLTSNYDVNADPHDEAVWGRIVRFEFPNSHQGSEDRHLKQRLREPRNLAGILKWAIDGARLWYEHGLHVPPVLTEKLRATQYELDSIRHWLEERTEYDEKAFTSNVAIRQNYNDWCEANGVKPFEARQLGRSLARHPGLERGHDAAGRRGFTGFRIRPVRWEDE